jgi:hypothetical protein
MDIFFRALQFIRFFLPKDIWMDSLFQYNCDRDLTDLKEFENFKEGYLWLHL